MKLSKQQKKILKSIPNKKIRLEQKLQFKLQNRFFYRKPIVFVDGKFETDNPQIIEFLSQHPMCEKEHPEFQRFVMTPKGLVPMSDEISNMIDKGEFKTWYSTSAEEVNKKFDELANEFISPEKAIEGLKRKIILPTGNPILDIDFHLSVLETVKDAYKRIEKRKTDKSANYESSKPRSIDPITPFTPDQIETVIDWMNTWEQLKDTVIPIRFKEDFNLPKKEGKRVDALDPYFCVITEENVADLSILYEKIMGEKSIFPIGNALFFYPNITTISVRDISSFDKIYFCYDSKRFIECVYSCFPKFANDNPKQFTLEDMQNAFNNGSAGTLLKILSEKRYKDFEEYIDSLKNS